jgi:hypothetical protein
MSMLAQAAAIGKTAVFSRTISGCFGSGMGLGFGKHPENLLWEKKTSIIFFKQDSNPREMRRRWR